MTQLAGLGGNRSVNGSVMLLIFTEAPDRLLCDKYDRAMARSPFGSGLAVRRRWWPGTAMVARDDVVCSVPLTSTTFAPASRAITTPAEVSQGLLANMTAAPVRPSATQARSMAAE